MVNHLRAFLFRHKYLLIIIFIYLLLRLINLTLLPVFNDEAIYLDWGWRETTTPGFLFYSLYDAKQPLLMWVFAIAESFFTDPVLGGRLVSVACGLLSLTGLYILGKSLWNKQAGLITSLLYAISPLFLFYDRQALMESAIASIGIWACLLLLKLSNKPLMKHGILLGVILGIGFFIKSSGLIFIFVSFLLFIYLFFTQKQKKQLLVAGLATYATTFLIVLPLLMQPIFWNTLSTNARFSLTLKDYLQFPIGIWWNNMLVFFGTNFFFLTPFVFLASIAGIGDVLKKARKQELLVLLWLFATIGIQLVVTRNASVRYLISFLPLFFLFAGVFVLQLKTKLQMLTLVFLASIPFLMSVWQITSPAEYILSLSKITSLAPVEYVLGQTSGYGIAEVKHFIDTHTTTSLTGVGIAENTGNPESAMEMYYENNSQVMTLYLDKKLLGDVVDKFDCLNTGNPLYFVSREDQQAGLNKFFIKIKTITNPYGHNTWGIYTLRSNCTGPTAHLNIAK